MDRIGVKVSNIDALHTLKRDILFFDKIIIDDKILESNIFLLEKLSQFNNIDLSEHIKYWMAMLDYLEGKKIIEYSNIAKLRSEAGISGIDVSSTGLSANVDELRNLVKSSATSTKTIDNLSPKLAMENIMSHQFRHEELTPQIFASIAGKLRSQNKYIPIFHDFPFPPKSNKKEANIDTTNFILKNILLPSETTSFDEIIEFKNDKDSISKLLRLKHYINNLNITEDNLKEKEEEFEHLYNEYGNHIKQLEIKFQSSTFQTIIVNTASTLENLLKLNLGKLAKSVFEIRKCNSDFIISEQKSPGKEVAFIWKANSQLSKK